MCPLFEPAAEISVDFEPGALEQGAPPFGVSVTVNGCGGCLLEKDTVILFDNDVFVRAFSRANGVWAQKGNTHDTTGEITGTRSHVSAAKLSTSKIALCTLSRVRAYDWNGTDFTAVGTELLMPITNVMNMVTIAENVLAVVNTTGNIAAIQFDPTTNTFSSLGSPLAFSGNEPRLATLSENRVIAVSDGDDTVYLLDFDGSTWSVTDSVVDPFAPANPWMGALNSTMFCIRESNGFAHLGTVQNNEITLLGESLVDANGSEGPCLGISETEFVIFSEFNNELRTFVVPSAVRNDSTAFRPFDYS